MTDDKRSQYIQAAKRRLLDAARDYALAKTFNAVLQDGKWFHWCLTDKEMYHDHYLKALGQAAVQLLQEISLLDPGLLDEEGR